MLKKQRKGFSLIELIVAIAILATMLLVLTPAALKYVDESRTAKDLKTTADFTEVIESSLADDTVYQEITKYIIGKYKGSKMNYSSYIDHAEAEVEEYKESLGEDSYTYGEKARRVDGVRYMVGGQMRGITITFPVTEDKKIDYPNGRINEIQPGGVKGMANSIVLKDASPTMVEFIKNKFGKDIPIASATYRYSEFTVFIYTGPAVSFTETADSPMKVYGQWDGTNLIDVDRTVGTPDTGDVGGSGESGGDGGSGGSGDAGGGGGSLGGNTGGDGYTSTIVTSGQTIPNGDIYVTNIKVDYDCESCKPNVYGPYCTCNAIIYKGGDQFPSQPQTCDFYLHGDYIYMYEQSHGGGGCPYGIHIDGVSYIGFFNSTRTGVWAVGTKDKTQTSYDSNFVETILGKPASNFEGVYDNCSRLSGTVKVPKYATDSISYASGYTNGSVVIEIPCQFSSNPRIHAFDGTVKIYHYDGCGHSNQDLIPEGGIYYSGSTVNYISAQGTQVAGFCYAIVDGSTKLQGGSAFPTLREGDVFLYNDYVYIYGEYFDKGSYLRCADGWSVLYNGADTTPGPVLDSIAGKPLTHMTHTFQASNCLDIISLPEIPASVVDISTMCMGCTQLSGTITIHGTPTQYGAALLDTNVSAINGNCQNKSNILNTR